MSSCSVVLPKDINICRIHHNMQMLSLYDTFSYIILYRSFLKNVTIAVLYIFVMSTCQTKQNNFIIGPQNVKHILT